MEYTTARLMSTQILTSARKDGGCGDIRRIQRTAATAKCTFLGPLSISGRWVMIVGMDGYEYGWVDYSTE